MQKLFLLSSILLLFNVDSIAIAQSSGPISIEADQCANLVFPYQYMYNYNDNGPKCKFVVRCESIPGNNVQYPYYECGLPSLNLQYCTPSLSLSCFVDGNAVADCIKNNFAEWNSCCSNRFNITEGSGSDCIKFEYTTDPQQILGSEPDPNKTQFISAKTYVFFGCNGIINLSSSNNGVVPHVEINQTSAFLSIQQFAFPCPPTSEPCASDKRPFINLCQVLKHEIGHLFGLTEIDFPCQPPSERSTSDGNSSDVMSGHTEYIAAGNNCESKPLTNHDRCFFCKLYCPGQCAGLGVSTGKILSESLELSLYPNPASDIINIEYDSKSYRIIEFGIFDILGNKVADLGYKYNGCKGSFSLPMTHLAEGTYIVRYQTFLGQISKKFYVVKEK